MPRSKATSPCRSAVSTEEPPGQIWPSCEPVLKSWVTDTAEVLSAILGDEVVGAYLHGSLAAGSYFPPKSDVDVLFVVSAPLPPARRRRFARTCVECSRGRPTVGGLECSVILAEHARKPVHPMPFQVHFGQEHTDEILSDAVDWAADRTDPDLAAHCQATREIGIALRGAPISDLFGRVPLADFMDAVEGDLEWILADTNIVTSPFYAVLNCCRVLWLWSGHSQRLVPSKEEAGLWAMERLPAELAAVVRDALEAYRSDAPVAEGERQTAGRKWDAPSLLAFRDYMRERRGEAASGASLSRRSMTICTDEAGGARAEPSRRGAWRSRCASDVRWSWRPM